MIELFGMGSPNVLKIVLMLEEAGLAYTLTRVDLPGGEQRGAAFRALNPNGKVPVIVDPHGPDGAPVTLFESGAILVYLVEKAGILLPADAAGRHAVLQWLMWQMAGLGPTAGQAIHFTAVVKSESYAQQRLTIELTRLLDLLDARLAESAFVAGDGYSIADIACFPWLRTLARFVPALTGRPALRRWYDAIAARPAAARMAVVADEQSRLDRAAFAVATPEMLDRYFGRTPG